MDSEIMSVRLKKGTKARLKRLGIDPSEETRNHLENLAWEKDVKYTLDRLESIIRGHSKPSPSGFAVKSIHEDRNENH